MTQRTSNGDIDRRLQRMEERLDQLAASQLEIQKAIAEFRGGKKVALYVLGGLGSIAAVVIAAKGRFF